VTQGTSLTELETSILMTLTCADTFDQPLTLEELHAGLFTTRAVSVENRRRARRLAASADSSASPRRLLVPRWPRRAGSRARAPRSPDPRSRGRAHDAGPPLWSPCLS